MARCLLGLGSNLGDRRDVLGRVCEALGHLPDSQLLARSRWFPTAPIGGPDGQQEFLNGAVILQTALQPEELALALQAIESQLGRERVIRWDARVIDIDLLLYDDRKIDLPKLTVPHPRMAFRRFVLEPACEIAGFWRHPEAKWTLHQLLAHFENSPCSVEIRADWPAIGIWLADELSRAFASPDYQGDLERPLAVKSQGENSLLWKPIISVPKPPNEGGGSQLLCSSQLDRPALVIVLKSCSPAVLLAAKSGKTEAEEKKRQKKIPEYFSEIASQKDSGPQAIIRSDDPVTIVQEAVAAISSAWPDLSPKLKA